MNFIIIASSEQQFLMGSQNSKFLSQQELPHEYRPHKQLPGVYESILNGARLQKHKISLNSEAEINHEKQIFVFRRMHSDRLISAHFFQKFIPNHFCNMSYQVCFFTEYPSYVLSLDLVIPMERGFHLLIQSLKGFELLHSKFGPFHVGFENIFFDSHDQLKVWISSDLGKTRIENRKGEVNEQKMIVDVFRIYDQIKDERNSQITFSNYLRRFKQKYCSIFTFKNVIIFLVDEASKYFINRTKSKECVYLDRKDPQVGFIRGYGNITKNSNKENSSNTISLKVKNRNTTNHPSTVALTNCQTTYNQSWKLNEAHKQLGGENQRKAKRHNSQEDYYYNSREVNFYRENQANYLEVARTPHRNSQNTLLMQENRFHSSSPSNTLRVFRRSLDEIDKPMHPPRLAQENKTKRTCIKKVHKVEANKHLPLAQTQIVKEDMKNGNLLKMIQCKNMPQQQVQKGVAFFDNVARGWETFEQSERFISPTGNDRNESLMMLSNLQTIKSIIHSDLSEMDSQIRNDLENLES